MLVDSFVVTLDLVFDSGPMEGLILIFILPPNPIALCKPQFEHSNKVADFAISYIRGHKMVRMR